MAESRRQLRLRIASASVLAPLAIGTAYVGGWLFAAFWGLAAIGVLWELGDLFGATESARLVNAAALALAAALLGTGRWGWAVLLLATGSVVAVLLAAAGQKQSTLWAALVGAGLLGFPVALRMDEDWGFVAIGFLFAIVWSTDVAAYFVGRALAGPKLWPAISPNKTWSGALGGMLGGVGAGVGLALLARLSDIWALVPLCAGLSLIAEAGDLLESAFKRRLGTKDAGYLIPGHGGLMDRLDGFLSAALAATVIGLLHSPGDTPARGLLLW